MIVGGASGAGKSFLLQKISLLDPTVMVIRKLTTRKPRPYEVDSEDLELNTPLAQVKMCDYLYEYGPEWYGIRKLDIKASLSEGRNPILIVRNCRAIHKIKYDFPDALVLYLQSGLSGSDLRLKLQEQGREDLDIDERMRRSRYDFNEYVRHINLFDHVLINYFDELLLEQMQAIVQHRIVSNDGVVPGFVFVLMSFNPEFSNTYKAMCAAGKLTKKSLRVERIDERHGDYKITREIMRSIRQAALIVCDITEERPNVYYELGYARGLKKTVILCAKDGTKLHFDVKDFHTVFYSDPMDLQEKLVAELSEAFNGN